MYSKVKGHTNAPEDLFTVLRAECFLRSPLLKLSLPQTRCNAGQLWLFRASGRSLLLLDFWPQKPGRASASLKLNQKGGGAGETEIEVWF